MASGLHVTIALDDVLDAQLDRALAGAMDLRKPMGEIAEEWLEHVHGRFADERDPLGVPWRKRRDNVDPERKVLHLTGDLERNVSIDFGDDFALIGVLPSGGPGKYARIHNEGGEIVPKNGRALSFGGRLVARVVMPQRQFVGFGPDEHATAEDVLGNHLRAIFSGAAT